ncbi:hypothetical protein TraAM80_04649 [Trypanosoma rangeli]|uniref:Uncharacterized protein n=1 Tax=Trypanosoma rangeli TaxID=5698 RepID=A0A422NIR2_TRYRA|nr:uncharacterized protein TraAM80_04649 [Trypanosoma rangeli]RNF05339.1 hypothetical protein TraAM80_04649 [Trypanosoma rangeli]|eukprot:RNF05339.1 hypothetical protein TraAM80_04649 [Trypanosoma rangeli]
MLHHLPRQGKVREWSAASEDRSASEEREHILQRLPASVQAMLLRSNLKLTESEMQSIACATADQRCEALRMIFEGQSAEDAVFFLLNLSCRNTTSQATKVDAYPTAGTATVGVMGTPQAVTPRSSSCTLDASPSPHPDPFPRERLLMTQVLSPPSLRFTAMNYCYITGEKEYGECASSSSSVPSPHPRSQPAPSQALREIRVNTAAFPAAINAAKGVSNPILVKAKKSPSPCVVAHPQRGCERTASGDAKEAAIKSVRPEFLPVSTCPTSTACSAWNEHYQTFIVHPNQLKRLEELEKHITPPKIICPRNDRAFRRLKTDVCRPFTLSGTTSATTPPSPLWIFHQKGVADSRGGVSPVTPRIRNTYYPAGNKDAVSSAPCVPPLKALKSTTVKEDVFTRLYTNTPLRGTSRAAVALGGTSKAVANEKATTPRSAKVRRTSSCYSWHTLAQNGEGVNTCPTWRPTCRSTTSHAYCHHLTFTGTLSARSHNGALTNVVAPWKKPSKMSVVSSREGALQSIPGNATAINQQPGFAQTSAWSDRHKSRGVYNSGFTMQLTQQRDVKYSAFITANRLKRSATATTGR